MRDGAAPLPRLIVALALPESWRARLAAIQPRRERGVRLLAPQDLHLTLHFIGAGQTQALIEALRTIEHPSLTLQGKGVGNFTMHRQTVLWAGVAEDESLLQLRKAIMGACGAAAHERYRPHLTVARINANATPLARDWLDTYPDFELPAAHFDEFDLFESRLGEQPRYHCLQRFPLTDTNFQ